MNLELLSAMKSHISLASMKQKIDPSIVDSQVIVDGYDVIRKDQDQNGGGVVLFISL